MSSPIPFRLPYAATADATDYLKALRKKRAMIGAFTTALHDWITNISKAGAGELTIALFNLLVIDLDNQIEAVMNPPPGRTISYAPSPEELVSAMEQVELYQTQVDAMEQTAEKLPEEMRPFALIALPMIKQQLRGAIEFRDRLQEALDAAGKENTKREGETKPEKIYYCKKCEIELVSELTNEDRYPMCPRCGAALSLDDGSTIPEPGEKNQVLYDITDPSRPEYSPPSKPAYPLGTMELAYACAVCGGRILNTPEGIFEHAETCPGPGAKPQTYGA